MASAQITYRPHSGATPEDEARALAAVYRLAMRAHEEKEKGALPGTPEDDVEGIADAHTARPIIRG